MGVAPLARVSAMYLRMIPAEGVDGFRAGGSGFLADAGHGADGAVVVGAELHNDDVALVDHGQHVGPIGA